MTVAESEILVSICCVCYNQEKFIEQTLDGFLMQETSFAIEIIVHDDASTDGTQGIIKNYADKDNRIIPILRETNLKSTGVPVFPVTYRLARGKYIALCEGDDYWTDPAKLQKQVDFLESNPGVVLCAHQVNIRRGSRLDVDTFVPDIYGLEHIVSEGRVGHTPSYVFRNIFKLEWGKNALDHFLKPGVLSGDRALQLLLCVKGQIVLLKGYMSVYRKHGSGIMNSQKFQKKHNLGIYLLLRHFDKFTKGGFEHVTRKARLKWLELILTRDSSISSKISGCSHSFEEGILIGLSYVGRLPYYLVKTMLFRMIADS